MSSQPDSSEEPRKGEGESNAGQRTDNESAPEDAERSEPQYQHYAKKIGSYIITGLGTLNFWLATGTWGLALLGYCSLQDTRTNTSRQLSAMYDAERPYLGRDEKTENAPHIPAGQAVIGTNVPLSLLAWNIWVRNYGRSIATVQYQTYIKLGDRGWECAEGDCNWSHAAELVPTQRFQITIYSKTRVAEEEYKTLLNTNDALIAYVRLKYTGSHGVYQHIICLDHHPNGSASDCGSYQHP